MYTSLSTEVQAHTKAVGTSTSLQKRAAGYQRAWYPAALESRVHFMPGQASRSCWTQALLLINLVRCISLVEQLPK